MNRNVKVIAIVAVVVGIGIAALILIVPRLRPHVFHGQILQASEPVADFTLTSHTGERVKLSDYRGKLVVLYFGYTFCPDVCPTTMAELRQAMQALGPKADQVQVLMVTVDPERDTPERLGAYVQAFDPTFVGLTGAADEIAQAAAPFGIFYEKHPVEGKSGYLVDHTATVAVLDEQGRLRLLFPYGTSGKDIADDLAYLMR